MVFVILVFLLIALFFGLGFAVNWLFFVAIVLALLWLIGFLLHAPQARWYRW